jgi:hypothetical protein
MLLLMMMTKGMCEQTEEKRSKKIEIRNCSQIKNIIKQLNNILILYYRSLSFFDFFFERILFCGSIHTQDSKKESLAAQQTNNASSSDEQQSARGRTCRVYASDAIGNIWRTRNLECSSDAIVESKSRHVERSLLSIFGHVENSIRARDL